MLVNIIIKYFVKINNYINKQKSLSKHKNSMEAAGIGVDENIVKDLGYKIKSITGKAGTIIFMSGNLLHSATQNKTNISRIHFNFNFSRRDSNEVRKFNFKKMSDDKVKFINFYGKFKDKSILSRSYTNTYNNIMMNNYFKFKYKFKYRLLNFIEQFRK